MALALAVCLKITVDVATLLAVDGAPDLARATWRISDFDEHAIEGALRLRERHGGSVTGLTVSRARPPQDVVVRALAMGLDALHVIQDEGADDPLRTCDLLAAAVRGLPACDLVFCGEGSVDGYSCQVGARLAEALDMACVTSATRLDLDGRVAQAERRLDDRVDVVECDLPAVITVGAEINHPRLPSVLHILGASRKPVMRQGGGELVATGGGTTQRTTSVYAPLSTRKRHKVEGENAEEMAATLLRHLREDGEVAL